jgi:hypothetical protein
MITSKKPRQNSSEIIKYIEDINEIDYDNITYEYKLGEIQSGLENISGVFFNLKNNLDLVKILNIEFLLKEVDTVITNFILCIFY